VLWGEQGAEATPRLLRGGQTPRPCFLSGQRVAGRGRGARADRRGGRVRGTAPLYRVRNAPLCPLRACFQPPKEAKFASDYPSSKGRLTVSGGFAHATGACLFPNSTSRLLSPSARKKSAGLCAGEGKKKGQARSASD